MATLVFTLLNCDGTPQTGPVTVSRRQSPQLVGAVLYSATEMTVQPDRTGLVSVDLAPGWYFLTTFWDRPVEFTVPDDEATHTLAELVAPGIRLTPGFGAVPIPGFAFRAGHLWLTNATSGQAFAVQLGDAPGFPFCIVDTPPDATANPTARVIQGVLQLRDPDGVWHGIWLAGGPMVPRLQVGDSSVRDTQRVRMTVQQLLLPNLDALNPSDGLPTHHALLIIGIPSGPSLAFGPNTSLP